jgi:hypothetical protein
MMPNEPFECNAETGRKVGRHRLGWLEDVENDLRELKKTRWRQKADNRE